MHNIRGGFLSHTENTENIEILISHRMHRIHRKAYALPTVNSFR